MDDSTGRPNPEMVTLARKSRGKSQSELANGIGMTPAAISRYEAGLKEISEPVIALIGDKLDYPIGFFKQTPEVQGPGPDGIFHRKRQSVRVGTLAKAYALAEIRRQETAKLLVACPWEPPPVPAYDVEDFGDPAKVARTVRAMWQLPSGPVFNMTRAMEKGGFVIFAHDFGTRQIDGFSVRSQGAPPMVHMNKDLPPDRWRWTLAHELGHIVLHFDPLIPEKVAEDQANEFASEFLAPAHEIAPLLTGLDTHQLAMLKAEWKISMQALIMRAYQLGTITAKKKTALFTLLTSKGYRTREPEHLSPPAEPVMLPFRMVRYHLTHLGYRRDELLELMAIGEDDFQSYYSDPQDAAAV